MRRHRLILATLVLSLLLLSSPAAASQAPTLAPQMYFPHTQLDSACGAPPEVPLALGPRRLAFIGGASGEQRAIILFDPVTNQAEPLIYDDTANNLAWSPDAAQIAFSSYLSPPGITSTASIKILRIADRQVTTIATWSATWPDATDIWGLSWSPDGQQIVFAFHTIRMQGEFSSIRVMRPDGTHMRELSAMEVDFAPEWSPDGQHIAFVSYGKTYKGYLYLMDPDGGNPTPITEGLGLLSSLAWSPDSRQIAFRGDGLFVINADGTGRRCLRIPADSFIDYMGSWSPDGRQIAYTAAVEQRGPMRMRIANVDGSGYSEFPFRGGGLRWAPR